MTLIEYTASEPVTAAQVKAQCRIDGNDEDSFLESAVIPGARALAEQRSGSAIRPARYSETFEDAGECVLPVGCVTEVESVNVGGEDVAFTTTTTGNRTTVRTEGHEGKAAVVTFKAGIDISKHPGVLTWVLLVCGWLYERREMISAAQAHAVPGYIADTFLLSIAVHPGY